MRRLLGSTALNVHEPLISRESWIGLIRDVKSILLVRVGSEERPFVLVQSVPVIRPPPDEIAQSPTDVHNRTILGIEQLEPKAPVELFRIAPQSIVVIADHEVHATRPPDVGEIGQAVLQLLGAGQIELRHGDAVARGRQWAGKPRDVFKAAVAAMARDGRKEQATGDEEAAEQQDSHRGNLDCPTLPHSVSLAEAREKIRHSSIISGAQEQPVITSSRVTYLARNGV